MVEAIGSYSAVEQAFFGGRMRQRRGNIDLYDDGKVMGILEFNTDEGPIKNLFLGISERLEYDRLVYLDLSPKTNNRSQEIWSLMPINQEGNEKDGPLWQLYGGFFVPAKLTPIGCLDAFLEQEHFTSTEALKDLPVDRLMKVYFDLKKLESYGRASISSGRVGRIAFLRNP